jgi:hypothetical protein
MDAVSSMEEQTTLGRGFRRTPPCSQCRQRKIKCDKQRPCENCTRTGLDCSYNDSHAGTGDVESHSELQERVAQLEAQLQAVTSLLHTTRAVNASSSELAVAADASSSLLECHCGRQILGTHFSVHYDSYMHWLELFPKVSHSLHTAAETLGD